MPVLATLAGVVDSFNTGSITVLRSTTGGFSSDGDPLKGSTSSVVVSPAVVHPASGRDLMRLPEGDRTKEAVVVFTRTALQPAREGSGFEADVIQYASHGVTNRYVVVTCEDWLVQSGHYRSIALREESA